MLRHEPSIRSAARNPRAVFLSGFSLIELVLVLAIVAVVAAIAAPRYAAASGRYQVQTAAYRVAADIAAARESALARSTTTSLAFTNRSSSYSIKSSAVSTVSLAAGPYAAVIVTPDFGGSASLSFDAWGRPSSEGSLLVYGAGVVYAVRVEAGSGRVSVTQGTVGPIVEKDGGEVKEGTDLGGGGSK